MEKHYFYAMVILFKFACSLHTYSSREFLWTRLCLLYTVVSRRKFFLYKTMYFTLPLVGECFEIFFNITSGNGILERILDWAINPHKNECRET
jgi:hypothetical protein